MSRVCVTSSALAMALLLNTRAQAQVITPSDQADPSNPGTAGAATEGATPTEPTTPDKSVISPDEASEIVVTGSRIVRTGAEQPTPVTVLSADEITATSTSLVEGLREIPQLSGSTGETSTGNMGPVNFLNLRNLGPNRTLVLLDGRRLTPATTGTAPNINALPQSLVKRVDIITGGASAAYGSDAVAGVVNFILDTKFRGLKGGVQGGMTEVGDADNYTLSLTGGTSFGSQNRGSLVASFEYYKNQGSILHERDWERDDYMALRNPSITATNLGTPANPNILILPNVGLSRPIGGVVTSGPLRGIQFGPGNTTSQYNFGDIQSGIFQHGGDYVNRADYTPLAHKVWRWSAFAHGTYELTDNLNLFGEVMLSKNRSDSRTFNVDFEFPIFSGNAFLPPQVQQQMTALNLSSISVGKLVADWPYDPSDQLTRGGQAQLIDTASSEDFLGGGDGTFSVGSKPFSWNVYYQHGKATYARHVPDMPIPILFAEAIDAVVVTPQNRGTSGLPLGSIVCRTSLTAPTNGCLPLDWLGPNENNSTAAVQAVRSDNFFDQTTKQDAAAINVQGQLFKNWAGMVSGAIGAEWRKVSSNVVSDLTSQTFPLTFLAQHPGVRGVPSRYLSNANRGPYAFGNYQPVAGSYNVKEIYAETLVPLLKDSPMGKLLEFNGAIRYADYSTSGGATTWKLGLVYEPSSDLRFRATRSRDVRAPNIIELFSAARQSNEVIIDPVVSSTYQVPVFTRGNANLTPETADTTALGVVFQPRFLPGFMASVDLYDIKIAEAITTPRAQELIDDCVSGSDFCALIVRDPTTHRITSVDLPNSNVAEFQARGADIEMGYNRDFAGGHLALRTIVTYLDTLSQASLISNAPVVDRAGEVGPAIGLAGLPKWAGTLNVNYNHGPFSLIMQERYIGKGKYNNTYNTDKYILPGQAITYINDNSVPSIFYTDVTARYKFVLGTADMEMFGTVVNLFDKDPPIVPVLAGPNHTQTESRLYDVLGRRFVAGLRFQF